MKVIYFQKAECWGGGECGGTYRTEGIYVPDQEVVVFREKAGNFNPCGPIEISYEQNLLEKMEKMSNGSFPKNADVNYTISKLECEPGEVIGLLRDVREEINLRGRVKYGIEDIFKRASI